MPLCMCIHETNESLKDFQMQEILLRQQQGSWEDLQRNSDSKIINYCNLFLQLFTERKGKL